MQDKRHNTLGVIIALAIIAGCIAAIIYASKHREETPAPEAPKYSAVQLLRNLHKGELTEWQMLTMAICYTESKFRDEARGSAGDSGQFQLISVYIAEVNRLYGTDYTIEDAFDLSKSLEMFNLLQDYYNPSHGIEEGIKHHNRSPYYRKAVLENLDLIRRYERTRAAVINYKTNPVNYKTNY